jgi:hypothetical protein
VKKRIRISVRGDRPFEIKRIQWDGHIVAGTDGTMAVTREARGSPVKPGKWWTPTHVPTGNTVHWLVTKDFSRAVKNAKRLHALFVKHGMPVKSPKLGDHFTQALKDEAHKKLKPKWLKNSVFCA